MPADNKKYSIGNKFGSAWTNPKSNKKRAIKSARAFAGQLLAAACDFVWRTKQRREADATR
jgi:hypothetical protein